MDDYPISGIYKHWKGPLYLVLGIAHDANEEDRTAVVYVPLELNKAHRGPRLAIRTLEDFMSDVHIWTLETCGQDENCHNQAHEPRFAFVGITYEGE